MKVKVYIGNSPIKWDDDVWEEDRQLMRDSGDPDFQQLSKDPFSEQAVEAYCQLTMKRTREFMLEGQDPNLDFDSVIQEAIERVQNVWSRQFNGHVRVVSTRDYLTAINERVNRLNQLLSRSLPTITNTPSALFSSYPTREIIVPDRNIQIVPEDEIHLYWNREKLVIDLFEELCSFMFRDVRGEAGSENVANFINLLSIYGGETIPMISNAISYYLSSGYFSGLPANWSRTQLWMNQILRTAYCGIKSLDESQKHNPEDLSLPDYIFVSNLRGVLIPTYSFFTEHPTYQQRSRRFEQLYGLQSAEIDGRIFF